MPATAMPATAMPVPTRPLRGLLTASPPTPPTPSAKPLTLTLTPLSAGVLPSAALSAHNLRVYDPGLARTLAYTSSITFIDGPAGRLLHRGYPIESLAANASYLDLLHLLLYSTLPTNAQLNRFRAALTAPSRALLHADVRAVVAAFPRHAHPMPILIAALSALGASAPHLNPAISGTQLYAHGPTRHAAALAALAAFPPLCAAIHRHLAGREPAFLPPPPGPAAARMTHAERFLALLGTDPSAPSHRVFARALELLLVLHADHEQNCSTATVRQLSSSGVDLFSALAGGAAALYGPLHGGATEGVLRMLQRVGSVENVPAFLERVKKREEKLMGFGHRVYRNYDPRARIIREVAHEVFREVGVREPLIGVAVELERTALADEFFKSRKLFPNCDFYSGLVYKAMGFEAGFFPVLFALARCGGWVAHWAEFLDDPDRRIARPHQRYVGEEGPKEVPPIAERVGGPGMPEVEAEGGMVAKL